MRRRRSPAICSRAGPVRYPSRVRRASQGSCNGYPGPDLGCIRLELWQPSVSGCVTEVSEAAVETLIPLLKDKLLAESWDLSAAYRYTDYQVSGAAITWKFGTVWSPVQGIRFRGTVLAGYPRTEHQ